MDNEKYHKIWQEKYDAVLIAYEYGQIELNDWEESFIETIGDFLDNHTPLSFKQSKKLNEIYSRVE